MQEILICGLVERVLNSRECQEVVLCGTRNVWMYVVEWIKRRVRAYDGCNTLGNEEINWFCYEFVVQVGRRFVRKMTRNELRRERLVGVAVENQSVKKKVAISCRKTSLEKIEELTLSFDSIRSKFNTFLHNLRSQRFLDEFQKSSEGRF